MRIRRTQLAGMALICAMLAAGAAAVAATEPGQGALSGEELVYEGAPIEVAINVNGEAATQLLGGVLDAAADVVQEQVSAIARGEVEAAGPFGEAAMAGPLIGPAKDVIKSVTRVTVLVMKPEQAPPGDQVAAYYQGLMTARGWTPMLTLRADGGENIAVLLAPGGKGLFGVIRADDDELIVGLITTREPLGDLLAQIVRAGGSEVLPKFLAARARAPEPSPEAEETCEESEQPEASEAGPEG